MPVGMLQGKGVVYFALTKNDVYSFEELDTLEKNATKLGDEETLGLIAISRASKTAKGEKPKSSVGADGKPLTKRARREERARR